VYVSYEVTGRLELLGALLTKYYENNDNKLNNKYVLDKIIKEKLFVIVDNLDENDGFKVEKKMVQ